MTVAVVTGYDDKGNPITRSLQGPGASREERETAYQLDKLVQTEMERLEKKLKKANISMKSGSKNRVKAYWELGSVLRGIFYDSGLITREERSLYWINARMHVPKYLLAEDRGPNRIHLEYCFRLAWYPREDALKRKWSEWVYLFDSPSINRESRFEEWDLKAIKRVRAYIDRKSTRLFIQCLNFILKDIETNDLSSAELSNCYEGGWAITQELLNNHLEGVDRRFKSSIKDKILEKRYLVGRLIERSITPIEFAKQIIESI